VNPENTNVSLELRRAAIRKFNSYSSEWEKAYFDKFSGGFVVVNKQRIKHSQKSKNEKVKFEKEYSMCIVLAQNGYKIEMLIERPGFSSSDITINGILAELKKTSSHNNIFEYAKKAVFKQRAKLVVFEFEKDTKEIHTQILKVQEYGIHGFFYFSKNKDKVLKI